MEVIGAVDLKFWPVLRRVTKPEKTETSVVSEAKLAH
jgi:hypothetical protein